jgi:uncharacterized protein
VRTFENKVLYAATDLVDYLSCSHLGALKVELLEDRIDAPPPRLANTGDLAASKGDEHERRHLDHLRQLHGEDLVVVKSGHRIDQLQAAATETREAMAAGASIIYQATFLKAPWMGYADFLERVEEESDLGTWSYIPIDTKLARSVKPYFVLQLCTYAELIEAVQGRAPKSMDLVLGDDTRHSLRFDEFRSYYRRMKASFLEAMEGGIGETYPLPVEHCEVCDWAETCAERRASDEHLSEVANLGSAQAVKFEQQGIKSVSELAIADSADRPRGMSEGTFEKLRTQAALQVSEIESGERSLVLLEPPIPGEGPRRGFGLLPPPCDGDLYFDIEGDPFYDDGLEYLWGVTYRDDGELRFRAFWGLDHAEEKAAFEEFVDFVEERRAAHPQMHVYHYAPYERTALGRLMGRYGTREDAVDSLFRERVLVDLYRVVEQSMQISRPSYSLKQVEDFYDQDREAEVKQAGDSVLMFEQWREDGDRSLLEKIEAYNKEDCESTLRLHEWLLDRREECEQSFSTAIPWRSPGEAEDTSEEDEDENAALIEGLLTGVPEDPEQHSPEDSQRWLLAQLLAYHRREARPGWWEFFARLQRTELELIEQDSESLGGMSRSGDPEPLPPPARSSLQRFSFPAQEHKIGVGKFKDPGSCGIDPETGESDKNPKSLEVVEVRDTDGELTLKLSAARLAEDQRALIPGGPIQTDPQRGALRALAAEVAETGLDGVSRFRCGVDILRRTPHTSAVTFGESLHGDAGDLNHLKGVVLGLTDSYLFIECPPGSGKTYTGAQLILELIESGRRVGVTANSHKAINNLLGKVEAEALAAKISLRGLKKSGGGENDYTSEVPEPLITNSKRNEDFAGGEGPDLLAGTAWLWCREEMRSSVDYLVIDEAGQISLADAIALSTAAQNMVLLGDPLQLAQVSQGAQPPGAGVSVLEHLLGEDGTIPPQSGVFLEETRRMHPDVCEFVSRAIYESRLRSEENCALQGIEAGGDLTGTGVRMLAVPHEGNTRQSIEEAEAIAEQIASLSGANFTGRDGETTELNQAQIMVVTPYNAQVRCLRGCFEERGLNDVAVGTVDKFQGQQAAVVFFSMATSSGDEIPRNVEFLYSRNRLNVAVSRAQCLAVLVASPELMRIACKTVEQMRLVNALCLFEEMASPQQPEREV